MADKRKSGHKAIACPVETTLEIIGGRWKVLILHHILEEPRRFGELRLALKGVSARTLTKQLRELERDGIVRRKVFKQIPPKVEYSLTSLGRKLTPILYALHDWGREVERGRSRATS
jgi:DNA-binding HxlR family transcriptional regulator